MTGARPAATTRGGGKARPGRVCRLPLACLLVAAAVAAGVREGVRNGWRGGRVCEPFWHSARARQSHHLHSVTLDTITSDQDAARPRGSLLLMLLLASPTQKRVWVWAVIHHRKLLGRKVSAFRQKRQGIKASPTLLSKEASRLDMCASCVVLCF